jgi:hypothetical protein
MSTSNKQPQLHAKNVEEQSSNRHLLLEESQLSSQVKVNPDSFPSPSLNVENVVTSISSSYQRKFNPWTDTYSGLHEYE